MSLFPNFPLYTQLKNNTLESSLSLMNEEKRNFIYTKIKNIKEDEQKIVYALIRAYYIDSSNLIRNQETNIFSKQKIKNTSSSEQESNLPLDKLPYGCKILKTGLRFDVDLLPTHLQYIILSFLNINKE